MILTFGELMLRLKSPGKERLLQTPTLETSFGGGEANTASALRSQGLKAGFVTALPEGSLGDSALAFLRLRDINTEYVQRLPGRMGLYFLEEGASQRPSKVIYDREYSALALADPQVWDWKKILSKARGFHLTGITPALSEKAAASSLHALQVAEELGIQRSLDLNYRKNLWKYGKSAPEVMNLLAQHCEVLMANEEDLQKSLGMESFDAQDEKSLKDLGETIHRLFPKVQFLTITLRTSLGADKNLWEALALIPGTPEIHRSKKYTIEPVVDRVGAGDAFAAGIILGRVKNWGLQETLEYATALSCLKHSVPGDQALITPEDVRLLLSGDGTGRVQR